ncbi:hypothetical protein [Streptomyces spiramyceticus]|uniref:hypothetical protein n=1 Tax=Streptomyces spiramyceticus TaxID=299717 RepID=UPI00237BE51A|nr:hypothetical protein [Streptomyces spiramyceticus]
MYLADVLLAAPPVTESDTTVLWWITACVGALMLLGFVADWDTRRTRRKVPLEQLAAELRREIRTGAPNVRGHISVDPSRYPGISGGQAEDMAREEGFLRQTHGTKGKWLFYRVGTQPGSTSEMDMRGGPPTEDVRQSPAAQRAARWVRERDGFDPLDAAVVDEAETGMRKAHASYERCFVGAALCALPGVPITIALTLDWVNSGLSIGYPGDVSGYVVAHLLAVVFVTSSVFLFKRSFRVRKEGRERYGSVLATYGKVVAAQENERRNQ